MWNCTKGKGEKSGINKKQGEYRNRIVRLGANEEGTAEGRKKIRNNEQ